MREIWGSTSGDTLAQKNPDLEQSSIDRGVIQSMCSLSLKRNGDARTSSAKLRAQSSRAYTTRIPLAPPGFEHARRGAHCRSRNVIRGGTASSTPSHATPPSR